MKYFVLAVCLFSWIVTAVSLALCIMVPETGTIVWTILTMLFTIITTMNTLNIWEDNSE